MEQNLIIFLNMELWVWVTTWSTGKIAGGSILKKSSFERDASGTSEQSPTHKYGRW